MLDALKNLGNLKDLMDRAKKMQEEMARLQEEMARRTATADAGGGRVSATVNGRLEVMAVKIDKSRFEGADMEMLEDLIVAAIRSAQSKAAQEMQAEMQKVAGELGLPPGMLPTR